MTRRKGEIARNDLKRKWPRLRIIPQFPHHVALPAEKVRYRVNREVIFCAAGTPLATGGRSRPEPPSSVELPAREMLGVPDC
jgi:hypothetical protein